MKTLNEKDINQYTEDMIYMNRYMNRYMNYSERIKDRCWNRNRNVILDEVEFSVLQKMEYNFLSKLNQPSVFTYLKNHLMQQ